MSELVLSDVDLALLNILGNFNDPQILHLTPNEYQIMKNGSSMVKVRLEAKIPKEFIVRYKSIEALVKNVSPNLELIDSKVDPSTYYLRSNGRYQNVQIPTANKRFLPRYIVDDHSKFDSFVDMVRDNTICRIECDDETTSLFERFSSKMYSSLDIEDDKILIYRDEDGIYIEIGNKSTTEGSAPSGARVKNAKNDHFVRARIASNENIINAFPEGKSFVITDDTYQSMQGSNRKFNMVMGSFEMHDRTFLGLHFISEDVEYFNILTSTD